MDQTNKRPNFFQALRKGLGASIDTTKNQLNKVGTTTSENPADRAKAEAMKSASEKASEIKKEEIDTVVNNSKKEEVVDNVSKSTETKAPTLDVKPKVEQKKPEVQTETKVEEKIEEKPAESETIDDTSVIEDKTTEAVAGPGGMDSEKKEQLSEEVKKQVRPQIGTLKKALENKEITQEEYNHFVFDRVMTSIGKVLGFFVSRDPSWLFYKDQWQERNANLLKEKQRLDRAKTTANQTAEETLGGQLNGEQEILTGEKAFAVNNPDLYNQLQEASKTNEVASQFQTQLDNLYSRRDQIEEQIQSIRKGEFDLKSMNQMIQDSVASWKGLSTSSGYEGSNVTDVEGESKNKQANASLTAGGNVGVVKGQVQVGGSMGSNTTKNQSKLNARNWSSNYDKYASEAANALQKGYAADSKQIKELTKNYLKDLLNEKRSIVSEIKRVEAQASKTLGKEKAPEVTDEEVGETLNRLPKEGK